MALSISTRTDSLYCADGSELVTELLKVMEDQGFSHIPVVDSRRRLTGVFSVGSLFAFSRNRPEVPPGGTAGAGYGGSTATGKARDGEVLFCR